MKLVLAEKPSVAQSIAKVLGATKREDGYLEGNGYVVSWCVGHLVELSQPEAYDEKYNKWAYADLPIFPDQWKYQVSASTKKQFGILKKLMARKDVESLVCATDAGREGELLSLPYMYSNYVIAYNKDIFDEANLEYPTADWTETEFVELAKTLTSGEGPEKTYGMWFGGWVCELVRALYGEPKMYDTENMVMQATNNEKFKAAFQLLGDLHKDGYCSNEVTKTTTTGGFVTGKYAMAIAMTGDIASYQKQIGDNFKWDIVELPISETYDTRWNTNMRLQGFGMSKTTEHPELAYDLIEYMTTNYEVQKAVDEDGVGIPALTEYLESEEFKTNYGGGLAYNKEAFVNMAKVGTSWEYAGIWADINDTLTSEFNAYITGATDIDTALDNLQKKGEAVIEAAKS